MVSRVKAPSRLKQEREHEDKGCLVSLSAWRLTDLADSEEQKLSEVG